MECTCGCNAHTEQTVSVGCRVECQEHKIMNCALQQNELRITNVSDVSQLCDTEMESFVVHNPTEQHVDKGKCK